MVREICSDATYQPFLSHLSGHNTHAKVACSHSTRVSGVQRYSSDELVVVELAVGNAGIEVDVLDAVAVALVISDAVESALEEAEEAAEVELELEVLLCARAVVASNASGNNKRAILQGCGRRTSFGAPRKTSAMRERSPPRVRRTTETNRRECSVFAYTGLEAITESCSKSLVRSEPPKEQLA